MVFIIALVAVVIVFIVLYVYKNDGPKKMTGPEYIAIVFMAIFFLFLFFGKRDESSSLQSATPSGVQPAVTQRDKVNAVVAMCASEVGIASPGHRITPGEMDRLTACTDRHSNATK